MKRVFVVVGCFCVLAVAVNPANGQFPGPNPALPEWKSGNIWNLEITSYPRKQSDGTTSKEADFPNKPFHMRVLINGTETVGPMTCWKIFYTCGLDAPNHLKPFVWIASTDRAGGWPRKIARVPDNTSIRLERFFDVLFPVDTPAHYPFELIPFIEENRTIAPKDQPTRLILEKSVADNRTTYTATLMNADKEEVRIRQTWIKGEPWWIESERFINGEKDLSVKRVPMELMKKEQEEYWKQHPKAKTPPKPAGSDPLYLARDGRLQGKMRVYGVNPKRADIIKKIEEVSKLTLTVAPNIADYDPKYGDLQLSDVQAWRMMDFIMTRGLVNGKWVKESDTGYRLEGEPTDPVAQTRAKAGLPPLASESDPAATSIPEITPNNRRWLPALIWSGVGIALLGAGILLWRRRARLHAAAVPKTG